MSKGALAGGISIGSSIGIGLLYLLNHSGLMVGFFAGLKNLATFFDAIPKGAVEVAWMVALVVMVVWTPIMLVAGLQKRLGGN